MVWRMRVARDYRIVYRIEEKTVTVVQVAHGRDYRDL